MDLPRSRWSLNALFYPYLTRSGLVWFLDLDLDLVFSAHLVMALVVRVITHPTIYMKGNTTMNNNTNNFDSQAFKAEFDRNTRIAMQHADKVMHENTPKFIDTAERSVNMIHFDISGIENWHLPFPN
jgi:hypothetical protein